MENVSSVELAAAKQKAIVYLEKSVFMLATLLGLDPDTISSTMEKPETITANGYDLSFQSLVNQLSVLEGLNS